MKHKGFTLLEVMIALTIFALIATTLSQTASSAVDNQLTIEQSLLGNWLVENEIVEMRSIGFSDIKTGTTEKEMARQTWILNKVVSIKKSFSGMPIPLEVKEAKISVSLKGQESVIISHTAYFANDSI